MTDQSAFELLGDFVWQLIDSPAMTEGSPCRMQARPRAWSRTPLIIYSACQLDPLVKCSPSSRETYPERSGGLVPHAEKGAAALVPAAAGSGPGARNSAPYHGGNIAWESLDVLEISPLPSLEVT